jgi:hypothetical protein
LRFKFSYVRMGKEGDINPIVWNAKMVGLCDFLSIQWALVLHPYDPRSFCILADANHQKSDFLLGPHTYRNACGGRVRVNSWSIFHLGRLDRRIQHCVECFNQFIRPQ